jgi:hypothetical protein
MTDYYPIIPPARHPHQLSATLRDLVGVIPAWMDDATCSQIDPERWFPDAGDNPDAKAVCANCPARIPCLKYALDNNERFGIWGGTSASDRERMRQKGTAA